MRAPQGIVQSLYVKLKALADSRQPDFKVGQEGDWYLLRWWVIPRNKLFNIYLHKFLRSDDDRALHDHPWLNCSLLLQGEYTEHSIMAGGVHDKQIYKAGDLKFRRAKTAHRVELHAGPCWSLFITGPVTRTWGFHCERGWRPWQEFVDPIKGKGTIGRGCD